MVLAELISEETGVPLENLMLLRHSNGSMEELDKFGGSLDEYTKIQPAGSKYDYSNPAKPLIEVVVVIARESANAKDVVRKVYRVLGVEREGPAYALASDAHQHFVVGRKQPRNPERLEKLFRMEEISSRAVGHAVTGWEGKGITPVQRFNGGFFRDIMINLPSVAPQSEFTLRKNQDDELAEAIGRTSKERIDRLATAPKFPTRIEIISTAFLRNADVIVEVLLRASGKCELCKAPAPFKRQSDGSPYLEVHHRVRLADGGEDTVDNAIAICPNCHRREHYG